MHSSKFGSEDLQLRQEDAVYSQRWRIQLICLLFFVLPTQRIINWCQYSALFSLGSPRKRFEILRRSTKAQK